MNWYQILYRFSAVICIIRSMCSMQAARAACKKALLPLNPATS
jgi:hypothetical protein